MAGKVSVTLTAEELRELTVAAIRWQEELSWRGRPGNRAERAQGRAEYRARAADMSKIIQRLEAAEEGGE